MASRLLVRQHYDPDTLADLDRLARESLHILLVVTTAVTWVWTAFVLLFVPPAHSPYAYLVLVAVSVVAWVSFRLSEKRFDLAVGVYLLGVMAAVTDIAYATREPAVFYIYLYVVMIAAMLTNPRVTLSTALACGALVWGIGRGARLVDDSALVLPTILILLAALISWVGSQRLRGTLVWALDMTAHAQERTEEARRHRAEVQRVLKSLDEAYVRLERANEALMIAQEAAERAYHFKSEFVAYVSHELRTPLNLITGFSEMVATAPESYGDVVLPAEYRGDVMAIYRSAQHLSDLIDDVLDLLRIEAGQMPLVRNAADLGEVVGEAAAMVRGLAEARGLWLKVEMPDELPELQLDRTRIRQVLLNLLTNATRFTEEGGIRVRVITEEDEVVVTVEDTGRGISPERIASAFEAFTQLEDGQARQGSGLGLAVSKQFVELHGGQMWIESEIGRGTAVRFTLPLPGEAEQVQLSRIRATTPARGRTGEPTVLIVHDDARTLSLLRRYVEGYQFVLAQTEGEIRQIAREDFPAVVVLDTAWVERWQEITEDLALPARVLQLTCALPSLHRLGLFLGAEDFLPKPVTQDDLREALARLPEVPRKALVVDDNPHVVRLFSRMLKMIDPTLKVIEAFGGREGVEIAHVERPDVVLLDLVMPEVDGYAFLEAVRGDEELVDAHIIIVSVHGVEQELVSIEGDIRLEREAGFSLTELLQVLRTTFSAVTHSAATAPASATTSPGAPPG